MNTLSIIILSLVLSFIVFALVATWYVLILAMMRHTPTKLADKPMSKALNITEVG